MSEMTFVAEDEPGLGTSVRRYRVACAHGASWAVLVPGQKALADLVVFDLLLVRHHRTQRCQCAPVRPALTAEARA